MLMFLFHLSSLAFLKFNAVVVLLYLDQKLLPYKDSHKCNPVIKLRKKLHSSFILSSLTSFNIKINDIYVNCITKVIFFIFTRIYSATLHC